MSKERIKAKLVVGNWTQGGYFQPCNEQPSEPITDMTAMLAWARATLKDSPGEYSFVRQVPGVFKVEKRELVRTTFA